MKSYENEIKKIISQSSFLVIGGAGTIGQSCVKVTFKRNPKLLHVIDINENNLVELVRDIRSSLDIFRVILRLLLWTLIVFNLKFC